jgi:L-alanine-DL-glutamate epimerase-like enolase superfamily enzyme
MGLKLGHRVFKIKIGRGYKWMPRAAGDKRDIEVVKLIRDHIGKDCAVAVDANNGYDLAGAMRFFEAVGGERILWAEEMFTENVEQCLAFKEFFRKNGWRVALADGETQGRIEEYKPYVAAKAWDVLQGDMTRLGVDGILDEAAMAAAQGLKVAPHQWGSFNGFYMACQMGRALANFDTNEQDPLSTRVLVPEGYKIEGGTVSVPEAPGYGMKVNEQAFGEEAKVLFDLKG